MGAIGDRRDRDACAFKIARYELLQVVEKPGRRPSRVRLLKGAMSALCEAPRYSGRFRDSNKPADETLFEVRPNGFNHQTPNSVE
jgi:hypothetical protein